MAYILDTPAEVPEAGATNEETNHAGYRNVHPAERIASGIAGAALTTFAVARKRDAGAAALALAGGYLLYRGLTGHCHGYSLLRTGTAGTSDSETAVIPHGQGVKVEKSVTIDRPIDDLFSYWRNFENLPQFMKHLESVTVIDEKRSHWVAKAPFGKTVAWDAEIINERPNEMIAWHSTEPADIPNAGTIWFKAAPEGRGTIVKVNLEYNPPAGWIGAAIAKIWGEEPNQQVIDDLRRFKNLMEAGESPTTQDHAKGATEGV